MTGKPTLDKILLALGLISSIAVLGMFIYTDILFQKPLPDDQKEFEELKAASKKINVTTGYTLKKVTINLKSTRKLRFLSTEIVLIPFKREQTQTIEDNEAMIRDIIIDTGSNMTAKELSAITGKIIFEEMIKDRINQTQKRPLVKEVFFSNFVIQ